MLLFRFFSVPAARVVERKVYLRWRMRRSQDPKTVFCLRVDFPVYLRTVTFGFEIVRLPGESPGGNSESGLARAEGGEVKDEDASQAVHGFSAVFHV
ncbi:MAG TPA: hypothetical protein VKQ11_04025 [Candidatus Sulfotelmatobacter sp.]|nr:hypothetical protein [Candidatus Sulfotelmatobacter sp.]